MRVPSETGAIKCGGTSTIVTDVITTRVQGTIPCVRTERSPLRRGKEIAPGPMPEMAPTCQLP
jgi:hypothetical protein